MSEVKVRLNRNKALKIAKDALAQLNTKKFIAKQGVYASFFGDDKDKFEGLHSDEYSNDCDGKEVQKVVQEAKQCNVCALGSLLLSKINLFDNVCSKDVRWAGADSIARNLNEYFTHKEVLLMEFVFELGKNGWLFSGQYENGDYYNWFTQAELCRAKSYGEKYEDSDQRLRVILLNIIRNNGKFVLPKRIN